jgi:GPI-anchor transamidase subunit T
VRYELAADLPLYVTDDLISNMSYILPVAHSRPATFQSILTIPGQSTLILSIDVTKAFLRYTEHPPDAQRGWDLPPAVFTPLVPPDLDADASDSLPSGGRRETLGRRIYTSTLLVDLATPDFSMPYNVIVLSCTLMAFIFGTVFNMMARKFVVVDLNPPKEEGAKEKEKEERVIEAQKTDK